MEYNFREIEKKWQKKWKETGLYKDSLLPEAGVYRYLTHLEETAVDSVFYVRLDVKESPTLFIADTSYMCAGSEVTLTAQSTGSIYQWNNGETQPSITVSLPGLYAVTVSNALECSTIATVQVISVDLVGLVSDVVQVVIVVQIADLILDVLAEQLAFNHIRQLGHRTVTPAGHNGMVTAEIAGEGVLRENALHAVPPAFDGVFTLQDDHSVVKSEVQGEGVGVNQYG